MNSTPRSSGVKDVTHQSRVKEAGDNVMRRHGPVFQKLAAYEVSEANNRIFVVYRIDEPAHPIDRIVAAFADEIHAHGFVDRLNNEEEVIQKGYKYGYDFLELPLNRDEAADDEVSEVVRWV